MAGIALGLALVVAGALASRALEPGVRVTPLQLTTTSGARLAALRFEPETPPTPRRTALLAHGITASKETLFRLGEAFAAAGFDAIAVDFQGHGGSRGPFGRGADLEGALEAGARALCQGPIDVLVGHSLGAGIGALAIDGGRVAPRLFIAIGSRAHARDQRTLYLLGKRDELLDASELPPNARVVLGESDHVLEPWDPALVAAALEETRAVVGTPVPVTRAWIVRLEGAIAVGAGAVLLLALAAPPGPLGRARGAAWGAAGACLAIGALALGAGTWVGAGVVAFRLPQQLAIAAVAGIASLLGGSVVGRAERWRSRSATAAQLAFAAVAFALGLAAEVTGGTFPALMLAIFGFVVLAAAATAWLVSRRTREPATAHAAFALILGYALGQWMPLEY